MKLATLNHWKGAAPLTLLHMADIIAFLSDTALCALRFAVTNHGVSPELIRKQFEQSRAFFELPAEEKESFAVKLMLPVLNFTHAVQPDVYPVLYTKPIR